MSIIRTITVTFCFTIFLYGVEAQDTLKLWPDNNAPYLKENSLVEYEKEMYGTTCVFDITVPTLTIFKARGNSSGKAVIIIPGGGYDLVAMYHEGYDIAKILSDNGITAAVLKYRIPRPESSDKPHKVALADARKAIGMLRERSVEYGFSKKKVGVLGFSAGSHLAAVTGLWEADNKSEVPDFTGLIYGVTRMDSVNLRWYEESLYYRKLSDQEIGQNTLVNLVAKNTPPSFLVHACDDDVCKLEETTLYAQALSDNGVMYEMHLFPHGGHGFGAGRKEDGTDQWPHLFIRWLDVNF